MGEVGWEGEGERGEGGGWVLSGGGGRGGVERFEGN